MASRPERTWKNILSNKKASLSFHGQSTHEVYILHLWLATQSKFEKNKRNITTQTTNNNNLLEQKKTTTNKCKHDVSRAASGEPENKNYESCVWNMHKCIVCTVYVDIIQNARAVFFALQ